MDNVWLDSLIEFALSNIIIYLSVYRLRSKFIWFIKSKWIVRMMQICIHSIHLLNFWPTCINFIVKYMALVANNPSVITPPNAINRYFFYLNTHDTQIYRLTLNNRQLAFSRSHSFNGSKCIASACVVSADSVYQSGHRWADKHFSL